MNPYQSPMPIEEESSSWLRFLQIGSREALLFSLGWIAMLVAALILLVVMPIAIGLAWHQYRRSWALIDLFLATAMTLMLPLWKNGLVEAWGSFWHGRI